MSGRGDLDVSSTIESFAEFMPSSGSHEEDQQPFDEDQQRIAVETSQLFKYDVMSIFDQALTAKDNPVVVSTKSTDGGRRTKSTAFAAGESNTGATIGKLEVQQRLTSNGYINYFGRDVLDWDEDIADKRVVDTRQQTSDTSSPKFELLNRAAFDAMDKVDQEYIMREGLRMHNICNLSRLYVFPNTLRYHEERDFTRMPKMAGYVAVLREDAPLVDLLAMMQMRVTAKMFVKIQMERKDLDRVVEKIRGWYALSAFISDMNARLKSMHKAVADLNILFQTAHRTMNGPPSEDVDQNAEDPYLPLDSHHLPRTPLQISIISRVENSYGNTRREQFYLWLEIVDMDFVTNVANRVSAAAMRYKARDYALPPHLQAGFITSDKDMFLMQRAQYDEDAERICRELGLVTGAFQGVMNFDQDHRIDYVKRHIVVYNRVYQWLHANEVHYYLHAPPGSKYIDVVGIQAKQVHRTSTDRALSRAVSNCLASIPFRVAVDTTVKVASLMLDPSHTLILSGVVDERQSPPFPFFPTPEYPGPSERLLDYIANSVMPTYSTQEHIYVCERHIVAGMTLEDTTPREMLEYALPSTYTPYTNHYHIDLFLENTQKILMNPKLSDTAKHNMIVGMLSVTSPEGKRLPGYNTKLIVDNSRELL